MTIPYATAQRSLIDDEPLFDFSGRTGVSADQLEDMTRTLVDLQAMRLVRSRGAREPEAA